MIHNIYILFLALLASAGICHAQANSSDSLLSLQRCRELALLNNAAIRTSDNDYRSASEVKKEAFTKYFPDISAGAAAFQANHDMLQYDVLDLFTLGLFKKGRTAGVWAVQPVFMGGQIVNGNKLAAVGEDAAKIKHEQATDDVLVETDNLYWKLTSLKAMRRAVVNAVGMLDSLYANVQAAVEAGMVIQNDLLKVDLKRNQYHNSLVDIDNGINLMKMLLAQQIGMGATDSIDISEQVPDSVPQFPYEIFVDKSLAVGNTADYRLLVKNVEAKVLEKKMKAGEYLPKVGIGAGWFYHNVLEQNHNFGAFMVTVDIPISGWWGGSHSIKKKSLEVENAKIELDDLSQKLEIEISDKWDNLTGAYRKMSLSNQDIVQSRENLRITNAYYDAGMNTLTDLLDAQALYVESQGNYINAYGTFRLCITQYLNSTGRLNAETSF